MKMRTRRFTALLCVFCMLFTSIPSSVLSDTMPATPTDLLPVAGEEPAAETARPAADRTLATGDDVTVTGELDGEQDYLIRFTPERDLTLCLLLTADGEAEATVTDEETGAVQVFVPDETANDTAEETRSARSLMSLSVKQDSSYLIRISGSRPAAFSLRLVREDILEAERTAGTGQNEPAAESEETREPEEETAGEAEESLTEEEKPEADIEAAAGEDTTLTGEVDGEILIRFTPDADRTLFLILTTDGKTEAEATDEGTGAVKQFVPDDTAEDGQYRQSLPYYKVKEDHTYLVRISGSGTYSLRLVSRSVLKAEEESETEQEGQEEEPAEGPAEIEEETGEEPEEEPEAEPVTEIRIDAADSAVQAYILFPSDAGIPADAELRVRELAPAEQEAYQAQTAQALNCEDESYLRYTRYLEFTLLHDGEAVELSAPVTAYVNLPDVSEGAEALQVVRFSSMMPVLLDSERTGTAVSFVTDAFDVFGIGNALMPVSSHETELAAVEVLSFSADAPVSLAEAEDPDVIEGLEVLGTFTIEDNTAEAAGAEDQEGLYIKAELKGDAGLNPMEGVALYSVDEDGRTDILMEELTEDARITELEAGQIAIVKDTGYRHLTLTVNPDEENAEQAVILDGMMPKDAEATVEDVTEQYTDYSVADEEAEPEAEPETAPAAAEEADETGEAPEEEPQDARTTLAAYDISIAHSEGDYQPDGDKPISVEILDSRIPADRNIELWHIRDDGTKEQITEFILEEGRIAFEATGFSVYVVIEHEQETVVNPRVEFHFISDQGVQEANDGNSTVYYIGNPYIFKNKHNERQTTQILKNGETLELIADPPNQNIGSEYKYFYGWYVVSPYPVSGTTNAYGIDTSNSKMYYTWTANPESISFETPITITETNVEIGDEVHWSLNGVSGTGTVDKDGNVHVFLAPIFEKYNFVNFMLYAKNTQHAGEVSNNLMTRKLIAAGSATSVEVKISDVRSNSTDPVHLVFTGWEYNAGTDENPDWRQIRTVNYTGGELTDPGKDGVYLTLDHLDDTKSIDLYPIFVEARWVDYVPGNSESNASYVASSYLESWGTATPAGTPLVHEKTCYEYLPVSDRPGYDFGGWYAFAVTDPDTGVITNLYDPTKPNNNAKPVTIKYIDVHDKFTVHTVTVTTTAIQVTAASTTNQSAVIDTGFWSLKDNGDETGTLYNDNSQEILIDTTGGQLRFFDALDRLTLYADWTPDDTTITVVYWTENARDKDTVVSQVEKENYTPAAVKTISVSQIGSQFASGSTITLADLAAYTEEPTAQDPVHILDREYLDDAGAVLAGEEKFYDRLDRLSDASMVINGDGSTIFNVYFERMTFKLVFHIGHDGYIKNAGKQKDASYPNWDGNWIEYMYKDNAVTALGYTGKGSTSYVGDCSMTYNNGTPDDQSDDITATSAYVTTNANVMGDYLPGSGENLYIIEAKYGAYIGNRWPSPTNPNFSFVDEQNPSRSGYNRSLYIWTAYYNSLYAGIANARPTTGGNSNGNNSDINGVYEYMSAELCANRAGTGIINDNHVHHLVAYFGTITNSVAPQRFKQYHIMIEAIDGTLYDPDDVNTTAGEYFGQFGRTTWDEDHSAYVSLLSGKQYYEVRVEPVISELAPQYQLGWEFDGYDMVYSCYNPTQVHNDETGNDDYHIYFFYTPKQYTLTFMYENENERKTDTYYYTQSLANAKKPEYTDPQREGYNFLGWYTNEAGIGDPFDFANETMPSSNIVLYPISKVIKYLVRIDPNGGVIDHSTNSSMSTYFTVDYSEPIGEYSVSRGYIKLSDKELDPNDPTYYTGTKYYYINTQYNQSDYGDWGLPTDIRNAVYVADDEPEPGPSGVRDYYNNVYLATIAADPDYWSGITPLTEAEFRDAYVSGPYRPTKSIEKYTFMGWYQVRNGSVDTMPYNFNDPVMGEITLRAKWRLEGGYYIQYNPYYFADDGQGGIIAIIGEINKWTDPEDPTLQLYADQSTTQILHAPTNVTSGWVFRGWRVVKDSGEIDYGNNTYTDWEPFELDENNNPVYYQPGEQFIVDAALSTATGGTGNIIHMQAYYEPDASTQRRPDVTNLILDANDDYGGYVNTTNSGLLPYLRPGRSYINTATELDEGNPTQILFGDFAEPGVADGIQSNVALHLYLYATTKRFDGVLGRNFFTNKDGYLLIGFDEEADPTNPSTGSAYVPAFSPDSVIAVTRNETDKILYAMWEPLIYVTFVNTTDEEITIDLSGDTGATTVNIINKVTGEYDREHLTSTITVPAKSGNDNGEITIVLPGADAEANFTATALNDHNKKKMSVSGEFQGAAHGTGSTDITTGNNVIYTGTLKTDATGVIVTYTERPDRDMIFNVNGGVWNSQNSSDYNNPETDVYVIDEDDIDSTNFPPKNPTRDGKIFIGWTTNADIAVGHMDFSSKVPVSWGETDITPESGSNVLEKIRSDFLWDPAATPLPYDQPLYAIWSDTVTVTFDIEYDTSSHTLHQWNGPATTDQAGTYRYYQSSAADGMITYTVAKGEKVPMPVNPSPNPDDQNIQQWAFIAWVKYRTDTNYLRNTTVNANENKVLTYRFDFTQPVTENVRLLTSWTTARPQIYTFTVENEVIGGWPDDEFDYTIEVTGVQVFGGRTSKTKNVGAPAQTWGVPSADVSVNSSGSASVTTKLKRDEQYTVRITVSVLPTTVTGWSEDNYSVVIDVIDRNDVVIKTGQLIYCSGNTNINFASDLRYIFKIYQDEKPGFTTTVTETEDPNNYIAGDTTGYDSTDQNYYYQFTSKMGTNMSRINSPVINPYADGETCDVVVHFKNVGPEYAAPTGLTSRHTPFILILVFGILSLAFGGIGIVRKKKRLPDSGPAKATVQTHQQWVEYTTPLVRGAPPSAPPCPRASLWTQPNGSSGKRGDTV